MAGAAVVPRRGGGPYNTALALGRLGSPMAFCSRVSTDGYGAALLDALHAAGVDTAPVQRGPEQTPLAVAEVNEEGSAGYVFYVEGTADRLFQLPAALPPGTTALSLGTCSLVLEPGATAYEALLHREAQRGVFTALDPNIRADLIADPDAYRARFASWLPHLDLLRLSVKDATWLAGSADVTAAARGWLAAGPAAVVLTHGADGLGIHTRDAAELRVPGVRVDVVDTIGAGDTVNAALLHRLASHDALSGAAVAALGRDTWRDILSFAARASALTCSRAGAGAPFRRRTGLTLDPLPARRERGGLPRAPAVAPARTYVRRGGAGGPAASGLSAAGPVRRRARPHPAGAREAAPGGQASGRGLVRFAASARSASSRPSWPWPSSPRRPSSPPWPSPPRSSWRVQPSSRMSPSSRSASAPGPRPRR